MEITKNFTTLFTHNTGTNADTVEWCPIPPFQNYFVCGTYCYNPGVEPGTRIVRNGSLILFCVTREELKELSHLETSAVLDISWCPIVFNGMIVFGVATGNGQVRIYQFSEKAELIFLTSITLNRFNSEEFIILSIDWSKSGNYDLICCTDSIGYVTLIKYQNDTLTKINQWNAHTCEAWSACFDSFNSRLLYSGGDDNRLNVWDLRNATPMKLGKCEKHSSGVTVLSSHPYQENTLLSGSYDETLSLWDTRNWRKPCQEMVCRGGLWRLKWVPRQECCEVLAACIFAGFEVINPFLKETIARYGEHQSLAYGADWCHLGENNPFGKYLVALCSYYDQKLSVCQWDEEKNEGLD